MNDVTVLPTAEGLRKETNTYRAMLEDTRELLGALSYKTDIDKHAAEVQIEAINQVLTDDSKPA
jgi:hypothetical protein